MERKSARPVSVTMQRQSEITAKLSREIYERAKETRSLSESAQAHKEAGSAKKRTEKMRLQGKNRDNNFTMIRFLAAVFVFVGHMGMILGGDPPEFGGIYMHEMGVGILFLMGGYLIAQSWIRDSNPLRYVIRRFFRLWPPFAVAVLVLTFVAGPLVSTLGVRGYFDSWFTLYLRNLRFFPVFAQPGVFTNQQISNVTNGSLWTMPVEAAFYVLTPFLMLVFRVMGHPKSSFRVLAAVAGIMCVIDVFLRAFHETTMVVVYGTDLVAAYHLLVLYIIGILFTYDEIKQYLNLQIGCVGLVAMFLVQLGPKPLRYLAMYVVLPYFIFSFALVAKPIFKNFGKTYEPSYGIYLYGFFFQQLIVMLQQNIGIELGFILSMLISAIPTMMAATLSYYFIETPTQRLSSFLVKKCRK